MKEDGLMVAITPFMLLQMGVMPGEKMDVAATNLQSPKNGW